jgi:hypothetical protein
MIIQKTWTELLGQPQKYDQIMDNEIVRPTNYFFIGDSGHKQKIWLTLWKFDTKEKAKKAFDIWCDLDKFDGVKIEITNDSN